MNYITISPTTPILTNECFDNNININIDDNNELNNTDTSIPGRDITHMNGSFSLQANTIKYNVPVNALTNAIIHVEGTGLEKLLSKKYFKVKKIIINGPATIVIWESGDKTVVKMQDGEKENDIEKAIYAAFTKRALSFLGTAKERSLENLIKKVSYNSANQ